MHAIKQFCRTMIFLSFDTEEFDVPREHGVEWDTLKEGEAVSKVTDTASRFFTYTSLSYLPDTYTLTYQIRTRLLAGTNNLLSFFIPNVSYHSSICGSAPFTRTELGE